MDHSILPSSRILLVRSHDSCIYLSRYIWYPLCFLPFVSTNVCLHHTLLCPSYTPSFYYLFQKGYQFLDTIYSKTHSVNSTRLLLYLQFNHQRNGIKKSFSFVFAMGKTRKDNKISDIFVISLFYYSCWRISVIYGEGIPDLLGGDEYFDCLSFIVFD